PVTIGPIMGQANAPTVREFVVTDALLGCSAFTTLTLPACSPAATCEIYDASATAGACLPSGGFPLQINFKVQNPGNELFEVWAENGSYLGIFPLAALPLKLPNYPSNGSPSGKVKVCINDRPDCCKVIEFQAPLCAPQCGWQVEVDTGKCTSDSTYAILVHLAAPAPAPPTDSFQIFGNGRLLGTYAWNQLPINIPNFPSAGGAFDIIRVCAVKDSSNTGGAVCCVEQEFLAPKCVGYPDCAISRIQLKTDSCTSDSTFRLTLNFMVADTMQVDSFSVFADGKFLGKYALSQLPLTLTDYPWVKGTIYSNVRVCTGDLPGCCRERKFAVPPCLPFGPCHVTDIQIKAGPCRADGSFQAVINFQATNPGNGTFTVFGNGQNLGTFPVAVVPVVVNFPSNGAALDVVKICVNLKDPNT
ncbi:MAG TPA: hypothetical protein PK971_16400, partial [Saprospiraceae bacterium]|nr:hypothetical protein [Saprospiraceae bacterium]